MRLSFKQKRYTLTGFILLLGIALIIILCSFFRMLYNYTDDVKIPIYITAIEAIGLLVSLIIALYQMADSKEIARATFLVDLNKSFVENNDYVKLYDYLQKCHDKTCELNHNESPGSPCKIPLPKSVVSNYLTFFETIYLLNKKGIIPFEIIDDLFAYRFFLAVHSRFVQEQKLMPQPANFINIFKLEHEWLEYRVKYKKLDLSSESVYTTNQLRDIVPAELYKKFMKSS